MATAGGVASWLRRHPALTILFVLVAWYYGWAFYVDSRPNSSQYYVRSYNPMPDARREQTFLVESSDRFAESLIWAVRLPYEDASTAMRDAMATRFGIEYAGPRRFGQPPLGESLNTELISKPYPQSPDLAMWKAIDGSSTLHVALVSARSLGPQGVTLVEVSRVDRWRSWAGREFHTGIQFPLPMRVDNFRSVVTNTEMDFLSAAFTTPVVSPMLVAPSWEAWRDQERLKEVATRAHGPV